jgi:hypothetical protein
MPVIIDILNCGSGQAGTWFDGCKVTPKDFTKAFLLSPAASIDLLTGTFDNAAIALLIKKGQLVPLNDALQVGEAGAKSNFQTLPNKKKLFISQGLLDFNIEFEANICLIKSLHKLAKKKWGLALLDSEGKFFFDNKGGKLSGFEIQDFSVGNETVNDGGSKLAMVSCDIQLTQDGTKGYNERKSFILSTDTLDFYSIDGVQDVTIKADTLSIAALKVSVLSGCDNSTPVLGLTTPNFRMLNAATGAPIAVTVAELGDGQYSITGATAGARTIQLFDSVNNVKVADILVTQFYQSNILAAVLVV